MRTTWMTAAMAAAITLSGLGTLAAADFGCQAPAGCGCDAAPACGCNGGCNGGGYGGGYGGDPCDPCGHGCGGLFGRNRNRGPRYEGLEPGFNCGCNGSYKFPVPPLYTYHWPGMWQQSLMTDYHSPWRFPPLKPYTDELPEGSMGTSPTSLRRVQQASAVVETPVAAPRMSFSSHLEATLR
jgi:hypothetical protein